jgi:hypothetical protein
MATMTTMQRMVITGQPACVRRVLDAIRGCVWTDNELFDLNAIVRMPESAAETEALTGLDVLLKTYDQAEMDKYDHQFAAAGARCLAETGCHDWSEWMLLNWGSQSNVYYVREGSMLGELYFQTSGCPVAPALRALSACFPDVDILLEFVEVTDADSAFVGLSIFTDGQEDRFLLDWCSANARDIRRRLDCIDDAVDEGDDLYPPPSEYIN